MIRLRTLGTLDLRGSNGEELRAVLAQPRRAALLAYLALATPRGTQRRDTILSLFWPELDIDRARNALGQALHFLRRAVGESVIVSRNGDGVAVDWDNFWCDAAAFEDALDANRVDEATAMYRGALLQGFHIDDAPDFERWLDAERARLAARYTTAIETLAMGREAVDDFQGAAAHWRVLSNRDSYNSRVALRLMRALKAAGDPAGALLVARDHEQLLREELGIAADAEVIALVRQLEAAPSNEPARPRTRTLETTSRVMDGAEPNAAVSSAAMTAPAKSRRVPVLVAALILASVGVAAAVVTSDRRDPPDTASAVRTLYDRGRQAVVSRSYIGIQTAAGYYRLAIERDSTFALAYAGLSEAYVHMAFYDFAPKAAAIDTSRMLAQRAMALDSTRSESRTALALSLANAGHLDLAEQEFRRALALGPNDPQLHYYYGMLLAARGHGKEALAAAERVQQLDPLAPRGVQGLKQQAQFLITGRRQERSLPTAERRPILKTETGEPWARAQQAADLADDGHCAEARADISRAQALVPAANMPMLAFAGTVAYSCGENAKARDILALMKARPDANDHALRVALLHGHMGEKDSAFAWLPRQRWLLAELMMLSSAVRADPLRDDPRLLALMRRLGIR